MLYIKEKIINFFMLNMPQYSLALVAKLGIIAALFLLIYKYKPRWRNAAYFVLFISLVRIFLFEQYYSWGFYNDQLGVDDVGWRQKSVIDYEHRKFFKTPKVKYFAMGSSQTFTVYLPYAEKNKDISVFHLSSMSPLDFNLYKKYVTDRNSDYLLLYLSEFDLARKPNLDTAKIAPQQGLELLKILPVILEISKETGSGVAFQEMLAGEIFPEYKYSFVFQGFIDKLMRKNRAFRKESLLLSIHPDEAKLKEYVEELVQGIDERWIKYNKYFLIRFLSYCRSNSVKVIIVEGQYNPLAYTEKSIILNQVVRKELEGLDREFDNVVFVPRSRGMQFTQEDYNDTTHVKPEPAYRFVESLLKDLEM